MYTYAIKPGHNQDEEDLVVLAPQPHSPGIMYLLIEYAGDGTPSKQAPFTYFVWSALENADALSSLLSLCGLASADSTLVTVRLRNDAWQWKIANATILRPYIGESATWKMPFPRDIRMLLRNIVITGDRAE